MNRTTHRILLAPLALLVAAYAAPAAQETPAPAPQASAPPAAPKGSPFLWRIEGHGAAAYLYGTIHLPDDRVLSLPDTVERAFHYPPLTCSGPCQSWGCMSTGLR